MSSARYDLKGTHSIEAGSSWSLLLRYLTAPDINGDRASAIPAGWAAVAQFRAHANQATPSLELTPAADSDTGEILLEMTPAQTRALPTVGVWGVEIRNQPTDETDSALLVSGGFNTSPEVVR